MKKTFLLSFLLTLIFFGCSKNNSQDPTTGDDPTNPGSDKETLKLIDARYNGQKQNDFHYVSMRFATSDVGFVTTEDGFCVSGSGALVNVSFYASSLDENNVPVRGTYAISNACEAFTVHSKIYPVEDGGILEPIECESGTVKVSCNDQEYEIRFSLNCSDGKTREYKFDGEITVIDESQGKQISSIEFRQGSSLTLMQGISVKLDIAFNPSNSSDNIIFEVNTPEIASIVNTSNTSCVILAHKKGSCEITAKCEHYDCTATITINVTSLLDAQYKLQDMEFMMATDEMPIERYCIYRLRIYTGNFYTDGSDASLTRVVDYSKRFPDPGTWLYRYTADNGFEEYGVFADSVKSQRTWLLSKGALLGENGNFTAYEFAPIMEFKLVYWFDNRYAYLLGPYEIVSDATANDTIRKPGVAAKPMPSYIQASRFNQAGYLDYCTDKINGSNVNWNDYNVFGSGDARFKAAYPSTETNETILSDFFGCVNSGMIGVVSGDNTFLQVDYYDIHATVYDNPMAYCLATEITTDPSTGNATEELIVPYQMAKSKNVNYTEGENPYLAKSQEKAILKSSLHKQIKLNNTISAVLRTFMYSPRRRWY